MFLAQLTVVITANRVHLSLRAAAKGMVRSILAPLSDNDDRMIVATRYIYDKGVA